MRTLKTSLLPSSILLPSRTLFYPLSLPPLPFPFLSPSPHLPSHSPLRVWRSSGEGVDVGREVSVWLEQYLGQEGYKIYYMSPRHKARVLLDDPRWADVGREGEVVSSAHSLTCLLVCGCVATRHVSSHGRTPQHHHKCY